MPAEFSNIPISRFLSRETRAKQAHENFQVKFKEMAECAMENCFV